MNPETQKLIQQLAEKLGTTVDHLWKVLIKQATVEAVICAIQLIVVIIVWLIALKGVRKPYTKIKKDCDDIDRDFFSGLVWFIFIVVSVVAFCAVVDNVSLLTTCLINPEYWALKQVLK